MIVVKVVFVRFNLGKFQFLNISVQLMIVFSMMLISVMISKIVVSFSVDKYDCRIVINKVGVIVYVVMCRYFCFVLVKVGFCFIRLNMVLDYQFSGNDIVKKIRFS